MLPSWDEIGNKFIFPAPSASYGSESYKRHLCWIPWNPVISPDRCGPDTANEGIPCLWFPAPRAAIVILFFHSNAEDLGMTFTVLKHMRDLFKVNVLAVEYPGYGMLKHMLASEDAIYEVALTSFRYLVHDIGVAFSQIILFGRSLGSGAAVYLAAQYPVGGLILVSPFASIRQAVQSMLGRAVAWSFKERFPNSRLINNVSCSTLLIHGEADTLIPVEHSLRLFKRCRARKLLITPPKMEHNSNLFKDATFLAEPAIHFFGFPGYYTSTPPKFPSKVFEYSRDRPETAKEECERTGRKMFLCDCLAAKTENGNALCRPEMSPEDTTKPGHKVEEIDARMPDPRDPEAEGDEVVGDERRPGDPVKQQDAQPLQEKESSRASKTSKHQDAQSTQDRESSRASKGTFESGGGDPV